MAISLAAKTRTTPPGGAYPYGDIKDDTGSNDGTPVNRQVYADFHQFFAKLLDLAGVVANGLPDNLTNGFQYSIALVALINNIIAAGGYIITGTVEITGLLTTGNVSITGLLTAHAGADMSLTNISNLASPLSVDQATNKFYVDQEDALRILKGGDAMTGSLAMGNNKITGLAAATANGEAVRFEQLPILLQTIIPMPVWDMDTTGTISVAHGLTQSKIRRYSAWVYPTGSTALIQVTGTIDVGGGQVAGGGVSLTAGTNVLVARTTGGFFDNTNYNGTAASRGFIIVESIA